VAEALVVLDGSTFFVSAPSGDLEPGGDASGYFFADIRHLSTWRLLADGEPLRVLSSAIVDYYSASIHSTLARARVGKNPTVGEAGQVHLGRSPRGSDRHQQQLPGHATEARAAFRS